MGDSFDQIKAQILENLSNGLDFSPKGSIDIPVRDFVSFINALPDYVTTSSCSGRISVSYSQGESKGVVWTLVKHGFVTTSEVLNSIHESTLPAPVWKDSLFTLKCEPFIMHLCCRDVEHAKVLHHIAMECGYRESGITIGNRRVMLALRTTSFHMELPIAQNGKLLFDQGDSSGSPATSSSTYLEILVQEANQRLRQNLFRTDRLLRVMKQHFDYPILKITAFNQSSNHQETLSSFSSSSAVYELFGSSSTWWYRWGHTVIPLRDSNDFIVIGGQGIETNIQQQQQQIEQKQSDTEVKGKESFQRSGRNVVNFAYSDYIQLQKKYGKNALKDFLMKTNPFRDVKNIVHGRGIAVTWQLPSSINKQQESVSIASDAVQLHKFLLISGGRLSPQRALDALQVYYLDPQQHRYLPFSFTTCMDNNVDNSIPSPRWGHTFIQLTEYTFFLCGGRNEQEVLDDSFLLQVDLSSIGSNSNSNSSSSGGQRDKQQSITMKVTWTKLEFRLDLGEHIHAENTAPNHISDEERPMKVKPVFRRYFHASASILAREESEYSMTHGCNQLLLHGGMTSLVDVTDVSTDAYLINFHLKSIRPVAIVLPLSDRGASSHPRLLARMGHNIASLPGKTLVIIGGMSALNEEVLSRTHDNDHNCSNISGCMNSDNPTYLIDLSEVDLLTKSEGSLRMQASVATLESNPLAPGSSTSNNLPCQQCRVHHDTVFDFHRNELHVIGGGAMTLAFGDHYCSSVIVAFKTKKDQISNKDTVTSSSSLISYKNKAREEEPSEVSSSSRSKSNTASSSVSISSLPSLLPCIAIDASKVKVLKTWLESKGMIEKSMKISKTSLTSLHGDDRVKLIQLMADTIANDPSSNAITSASFMAVPVVKEFFNLLMSGSFIEHEFAKELCSILQTNSVAVAASLSSIVSPHKGQNQTTDELATSEISRNVEEQSKKLEQQQQQHDQPIKVFNKRPPFVTNETKANNFLKQYMAEHHIAEEYQGEIPTKYELVGDILMIPDKAFSSDPWKDAIQQDPSKFWSTLTSFFKVHRVARKAFIHSGPMRKSQVQLLYFPNLFECEGIKESIQEEDIAMSQQKKKKKLCVCGEDHSMAPGWVTVIENKIKFSFDITRVMFCSGNNTERMRMGSLRIPNETVVDFYCGIGYYTVPLLFYSQLKFLYALEWNPDSIFALKHNLAKANISPERYQILFGDNQITSQHLVNVADRILLGLLPSSVPGWKLAARALKVSGGMIHVHENVHERDIKQWIEDMKLNFEELLLENGKCMDLVIQHVEIVKSYAPRVYHYVVDVKCTPRDLQV